MDGYNVKNYTEQGGEVTHIGGKLIFEKGAKIEGAFAPTENQAASTATQVSGLKSDFNDLLMKLKEAGLMTPDTWNLSVRLAPALTDSVVAANNAKSSVALADGVITVTANIDELEESEIAEESQEAHKWLGLGIGTGLSNLTLAKYNGEPLTEEDATKAASVGLNQPGEFLLYVCAEEIAVKPKVITLKADGYSEMSLSITLVAPVSE